MLCLLLNLCGAMFALPCAKIVRIVPKVPLRPIPHAPAYFAGLLLYHGLAVPVVDLCALTSERVTPDLLSSRIVLVHYGAAVEKDRILGLLAEQIMETIHLDEKDFANSTIKLHATPYLGRVANTEVGLVQLIEVQELLPETVRQQLFPEPAVVS
jgi:chemotaxis-related protein WspB